MDRCDDYTLRTTTMYTGPVARGCRAAAAADSAAPPVGSSNFGPVRAGVPGAGLWDWSWSWRQIAEGCCAALRQRRARAVRPDVSKDNRSSADSAGGAGVHVMSDGPKPEA